MRHLFRRYLIPLTVLPMIAIALTFLITTSLGKSSASTGWQVADRIAPSNLLEQVIKDNLQPGTQVDAAQMKVWKIQQSGQAHPLYLIDTRIANAAKQSVQNPLCGVAGCVFLAYVQMSSNNYQRVLNTYLDPRLPPSISLIKPLPELHSGLPCLLANQLEKQKIRTFKFCFNGTTYEVVETQLLPKIYE